MKKILLVFLVTVLTFNLSTAQEKTYRIITSKGDVIYTKKMRDADTRLDVETIDGKIFSFKKGEIISVREEIPNWNYFEFGKEEFTDYVVVKVDSLNQEELFKKAINWIKDTYKNPDEVINTTIDNSKVRIEGFKEVAIQLKALGMSSFYGGTYSIEIIGRLEK